MAITGKLVRSIFADNWTGGQLDLYDGSNHIFTSKTCEDKIRGDGLAKTVKEWKIAGKSAIPYGEYKVNYTYSPKFAKNMWQVMNVPGFQGIRIHSGNTETDTEGCLIVGRIFAPSPKHGVLDSRGCLDDLMRVLSDCGNPQWTLEIVKSGTTLNSFT